MIEDAAVAVPAAVPLLERIERIYLAVLRATILLLATLLVLYTFWLAGTSLYKILRSVDSVKEQPAAVAAEEIADAEATMETPESAAQPVVDTARQKMYTAFVNRYYRLYKAKFEPYRQGEDKILSKDEFDDLFVQSETRLADAPGDTASERSDLDGLYRTMSAAAGLPAVQKRLSGYQHAKKINVTKQVQRTRTVQRRGWDAYSQACEDWFYRPYGCAVTRAVQVPYTETVTVLEFPKGTQSHEVLFRALQDKYTNLLTTRRGENAARAQGQREEIAQGNIEGKLSLFTALQVFGGFIVLMFFFILIAIERHQRRLAEYLQWPRPI